MIDDGVPSTEVGTDIVGPQPSATVQIEILLRNGRGLKVPATMDRSCVRGSGMIGPSENVKVYHACGATDMRKGIDGLASLAETIIKQDPGSGAIFGFRGKRADGIKLLRWDTQGFCLYYKVVERGYFSWPTAKEGVANLTSTQLSMLVDTIDWRRPAWTLAPSRVG